MSRLFTALSTALSLAVLGGGCTSSLDPAAFQADAVSIACEKAFECCDADELAAELAPLGARPATVEECEEVLRRRYSGQGIEGSVEAGRAAYDRTQARACLDGIRAQTCAEYRGAIVDIASVSGACGGALTPQVVEGGICTHDYECTTGWCDTGGIGDGNCAPVPGEGEPCELRCASGLRCEAGTCARYESPPGYCDGPPPAT